MRRHPQISVPRRNQNSLIRESRGQPRRVLLEPRRYDGRFAVKHFAARVQREAGERRGVSPPVEQAYRLALGREPRPEEARRAAELVRDHGLEALCWALLNTSEFLYVR